MELETLIRQLEVRHREILELADTLHAALRASGQDDALSRVFAALTDAVAFHFQREERLLFPYALSLGRDGFDELREVERALEVHELEDAELMRLVAIVRVRVDESIPQASRYVAFVDALQAHEELEASQLFPLIRRTMYRSRPLQLVVL